MSASGCFGITCLVTALLAFANLATSDGPNTQTSPAAFAATSPDDGGVQPGDPVDVGTKVCDSDELQNQSCTNPGNCRNACAFWCGSSRECRQCCQAFRRPSRNDCLSRCDEVWNP